MQITRLLIDYSALCYQVFYGFVAKDQDLETNEDKQKYFCYMLLNKLIILQKNFEPNEIIICNDHKSWRKKYFEYYKAQREIQRAKNPLEVELLFNCKSAGLKLLKQLNYKVMMVENCEADDIIAFLCDKFKDDKTVIVSSDKDFQQLTSENVKLYSYIKNEILNCEDKERFTIELVLHGDVADGIPNVLSDDDTFIVSGKRQKPLSKKKINEILSIGIDEYCKRDNVFARNYDRNKKLILLNENYIPKDIWKNMQKIYYNINNEFKRKSLSEIRTVLENNEIVIVDNFECLG